MPDIPAMGAVIRHILLLMRMPLRSIGRVGGMVLSGWKKMSGAVQGATFLALSAVIGLIADVGGIAGMIFGKKAQDEYVCTEGIEPYVCNLLIARHDGLLTPAQSTELNNILIVKASTSESPGVQARPEDLAAVITEATSGDSEADDRITALLAEGKTIEAVSILKESALQSTSDTASKWQQVGTLALGHDTAAAIEAWTKVTELTPDDTWSWIYLSRAHQAAGNLPAARIAAVEAASVADADRDRTFADTQLGDIYIAQGEYALALDAYNAVLTYRQEYFNASPSPQAQLDLSDSYERMGHILFELSELNAARDSYGLALTLRQGLSLNDAGMENTRRGLAVIHERIGDIDRIEGNLPAALSSYEKAYVIVSDLSRHDTENMIWQRDMSVFQYEIGNVLRLSGDYPGALAAYSESQTIVKSLLQKNPTNADLKRDLALNQAMIGETRKLQGYDEAALAEFETALELSLDLVRMDMSNVAWQRDVAMSYRRVGDMKAQLGDKAGALDAYQSCIRVHNDLLADHAPLPDWLYDLSIAWERIGDLMRADEQYENAMTAYSETRVIRHNLGVEEPANPLWRRDEWFVMMKMADVQMTSGNPEAARMLAEKGLAIGTALAASGYNDPRISIGLNHGEKELARYKAALR